MALKTKTSNLRVLVGGVHGHPIWETFTEFLGFTDVALFLLTKLFEFTTKDVSKGINFETAY